MPTPLSPSSSQEIISISPPPEASSSRSQKRKFVDPLATTLPRPETFIPRGELKDDIARHIEEQEKRIDIQNGKRRVKREASGSKRVKVEDGVEMSRTQVTNRMMATLGKDDNPITNSDLYSRTDHFVSASTGHQQSNRGGGSSGAATYWAVRTAKMEDQAREKKSDLFKGCVFYLNGSTGPKVSNLQAQHMITANGGRFLAMCNASCTHIIASGGLSGSKTQKWIDGQAGRGASKRTKVVRVDWLLDCVERGRRINEADYGVIKDSSQKSLLGVFSKSSSSPSR
ncbi:BRCT domain-containing protein [Kockovaella imperatae]|uniref:BRCT domain-containing protein n=1 Tax=Kockovaella imperatae TaxID=4999 RepID=A0A1Y1U611_9TREE|nr:BRCT domain-containing protein [Kockovaella imperatae]ORX33432.1 BRCT domain-containing protein [Kockovaella imperatae]